MKVFNTNVLPKKEVVSFANFLKGKFYSDTADSVFFEALLLLTLVTFLVFSLSISGLLSLFGVNCL